MHSPASSTEKIITCQHGKMTKVRGRKNEQHFLTFDLIDD
jgi:hypothetical protein